MANKKRSCDPDKHKLQLEEQETEIEERLGHIKHKILVMSGLQCPYCGRVIDVFKQHGGSMTAKNENLRLLSTLPLDPEVVNKGDTGDMSLLDNRDHPITVAFNKRVNEIVKMHAAMKIPACEPKVPQASLS